MPNHKNLLADLQDGMPKMSRAFQSVAAYVIEDPDRFLTQPLRDLSESISVSEPSLIRFCRHLGYGGLPDFRLALAMSIASNNSALSSALEPDIHMKSEVNFEEKSRVAEAARKLVEADRSILLDSGSTVQIFSTRLSNAQPLVILTTGLLVLLGLRDFKQHKLMLPGGVLRPDAMSLTGRMVENTLASMSFDTAYIGADSISLDFGLSTFSEDEAHLTRAMLKSAKRVVVLADASKFRAPALHKICDVSDVDIIVTDANLTPDLGEDLLARDIELIIAPDIKEHA